MSPSLSSASFFLLLLIAALVPPADVGVGWAEPLSRNDVVIGVGACDAGVEPTEPGVPESCFVGIPSQTWIANASGRGSLLTPLLGRYDIEDLENTRFCSIGPVLRRCAAAPLVPFM